MDSENFDEEERLSENDAPEELDAPEDKLNIKRTLMIGLGFMTTMLAWGMYNFYVPRVLAGHIIEGEIYRLGYFTGDMRVFLAMAVMVIDNIIAILLQPYFGELSDRLKSKFGRRTPFLMIGIPISALALLLMPFVVRLSPFWIIFASLMVLIILFNFAMAFYRAPIVALMPDVTPSQHRSMANVLINATGGVGVAIGFMIPPLVGGIDAVTNAVVPYSADIEANLGREAAFLAQDFVALDFAVFGLTALCIMIILVAFLFSVKETPTGDKIWEVGEHRINFDPDTLEIIPPSEIQEEADLTKNINTAKEVKGIFLLNDKSTAYMLLAFFMWSAADDAFNFALSLWAPEYLGLPDNLVALLAPIMGVFVLLLGIPGAYLAKTKGRIFSLRAGFLLIALGYGGMIIFQELLIAGHDTLGFIGVAISLGIKQGGSGFLGIVAITAIWQMAPKDKVGTYTGIYYIFRQGGSVIGPLLVGAMLSFVTPLMPEPHLVWIFLIPACFLMGIIGLFLMFKSNRGEVGDEYTPEELEVFAEIHGTASAKKEASSGEVASM